MKIIYRIMKDNEYLRVGGKVWEGSETDARKMCSAGAQLAKIKVVKSERKQS